MIKKTEKVRPITHSDVLWHFTGGAKWNESKNSQSKHLKSLSESYSRLIGILDDRELKLGGYHEVVGIKIPEMKVFNKQNKKFETIHNKHRFVKTAKVCCVADIPKEGLRYHSKRYGKFGIGFKRSSLIKGGFNPVFYTLYDQSIISHFISAQDALVDSGEVLSLIEDIESQIDSAREEAPDYCEIDIDTGDAVAAAEGLESAVEEASCELEKSLAYIKTFDQEGFDTIYAEREWRSVVPFKFRWGDVDALIMPKKYLNEFKGERKDLLSIPKRIKLLEWENL